MNAIDTNVWIYRHDTRDPHKQTVARRLVSTVRPIVLPWQVGCEFMAATRKLAPLGFDAAMAWDALTDMQAIATTVLLPDIQLWQDAQSLQARHILSFWDALLVAACLHGGVKTLYTEDMGSPRQIDGLLLVNPFLPAPTP
jgi:predicted nucleic acid-binding protein